MHCFIDITLHFRSDGEKHFLSDLTQGHSKELLGLQVNLYMKPQPFTAQEVVESCPMQQGAYIWVNTSSASEIKAQVQRECNIKSTGTFSCVTIKQFHFLLAELCNYMTAQLQGHAIAMLYTPICVIQSCLLLQTSELCRM